MIGADKKCLKCGADLPSDPREGFCAECLFELALSIPEEDDADGDSAATLAAESSTDEPESGSAASRQFGNYELLEELGRGGMGIVYKARQLGLGRLVAVKLLRFGPLAGDEIVKRLRMEAAAAGCLRHPNIVSILEVGICDEQHYLAMDYVAGPNLARLAAGQPMPAKRAAKMAKAIAEAIGYAHEHGVLHRDLKPSNILVGSADEPRITDFGLAKRIDRIDSAPDLPFEALSSLTMTGQMLGTPNYMPPEQASSDRGTVGCASDVYSIGAILYELLTGRPPFVGETLAETLHHVLESEPASPRLMNPRVSVDLETICLKCLEKEPARRYATARDLAADLGRYLDGAPVLARPVGRSERIARWCRKNQVLAGLVLATAALLFVMAIGSSIAAYRINLLRLKADRESQRAQRGEAEVRQQLYGEKMGVAQSSYTKKNFLRLAEILEDTREFSSRGFEWFFWQDQLRRSTLHLQGHLETVSSVAFSPDSQFLASAGEDSTVRIWETASGHELVRFLGHKGRVQTAAWFPDGRYVVSAGDDHLIKVWEAASGTEIATLKSNHGRIYSVAISQDGRIALGNQDGTVTLWSWADRRETAVFSGHAGEVWKVAFSLDGRSLLTSSADGSARIWNLADGQTATVLRGHNDDVFSAAFSPDSRRVATAGRDRLAIVWDTLTGQKLFNLKMHPELIRTVSYSPDGRWIATGGDDWSVRLWNASDGSESMTVDEHRASIHCVAFSPNGKWMAAGANDSTLRLWNLRTELDCEQFQAHSKTIQSIAFTADGKLVTAGADQAIRIWEESGRTYRLLTELESKRWFLAAVSGDASEVATADEKGAVTLWNTRGDQKKLTLATSLPSLSSIAFSSDKSRVLAGSLDGSIKLWDSKTGRELQNFVVHSNSVRTLTLTPDGLRIVSSSRPSLVITEVASGRQMSSLTGHLYLLATAALSPDGKKIVSGSQDRSAKVWDAENGHELLTLRGHSGTVGAAAFSADNQRVLTGSVDGTVRLWDAINGSLLLTLSPGISEIVSLAFSADGKRIAAGDAKGKITVWDTASENQIATWEQEDEMARHKADQFRQEVLDGERKRKAVLAADPGALREWLILAPIPFASDQGVTEALEKEFCSGESDLRPAAGGRVRFGGQDLTWQPVRLGHYVINFSDLVGRMEIRCVAYAVCYIKAEEEMKNLRMLVGSDDLSKIYLNSRQVYASRYKRSFREDEDNVEGIHLQAGINTLVFKVVNWNYRWLGSIRLVNADGSSLQGIRTLSSLETESP